MALRFDNALRIIRGVHYGRRLAPGGWVYAAQLDHRFLDGRLQPLAVSRRPVRCAPLVEDGDPEQAAGAHLDRLARLGDPEAVFAALDELTRGAAPSTTWDNVTGLRAWGEGLGGAPLAVVIVGAGPVGLTLASALKVAFGASIDVLVVDNRVAAPHRKLPYQRRWITAVKQRILPDLVEERVARIFATIGTNGNIGAPIDVYETLLLLSCRRLGVRLLFSDDVDLATVADLPVDLVFDASGNRLAPLPRPTSPDQVEIVDWVGPDSLVVDVPAVERFGVTIRPFVRERFVVVGRSGGLYIPTCDNHVMKQAMVKLISIPGRLHEPLLAHLRRTNADNKFYLWPGSLEPPVNELLLIVSLERAEYEALCRGPAFPLPLAEAVELSLGLDERTPALLGLIHDLASEPERARMSLDAPFLYRPYLVEAPGPEQFHGKPFVRVGDSVYNGNVKMANGLGPHLAHLRLIQETLWRTLASERADAVGRAMTRYL